MHGGIDGLSRTIVFLRCSTDNRAPTMSAFYDAVKQYGLPSQIRSDCGGENVNVWRFMYDQYQSESAILVGSSTGLSAFGGMSTGV